MHPDRTNFAKHIREGNQCLATNLNRCLETQQSPLEKRPYPVNWTHWTESEFHQFLLGHGFPPNTIGDRLIGRRYAVSAALEAGHYVPAVVLEEEGMESVVNDAIMMARAALHSELQLTLDELKRTRFEKYMGYWHSEEKYTEMTLSILRAAFVQAQRPSESCLAVKLESWESGSITLKLIEEIRPRHGRFGMTFAGIEKHILIKDGSNPNCCSSLFSIKWKVIEPMIVQLLVQGDIHLEQIWLLTGTSWAPPRPVLIEVIRSTAVECETANNQTN
jgi:hypothetical protein